MKRAREVMARDPWKEFKEYDPHEQLNKWDRMQGHKRYEILLPLGKVVSVFRKLFGKKEKREWKQS